MADDVVQRDELEHHKADGESLRRKLILAAADRVAGSLADEDTPGWNTPDEVQQWVRAQRRTDNDRVLQGLDENGEGNRLVQPTK
jgi:hypothetical protein